MILIKITVLDNNEQKIITETQHSYTDSLEFIHWIVHTKNYNILKIELEKVEG